MHNTQYAIARTNKSLQRLRTSSKLQLGGVLVLGIRNLHLLAQSAASSKPSQKGEAQLTARMSQDNELDLHEHACESGSGRCNNIHGSSAIRR